MKYAALVLALIATLPAGNDSKEAILRLVDELASSAGSEGASLSDGARRSDTEVVQGDVRRLINAVYAGDVDVVLGYTHPSIVELAGGQAQMEVVLRDSLAQMKNLNMRLESLAFPSAPVFVPTEANRIRHCSDLEHRLRKPATPRKPELSIWRSGDREHVLEIRRRFQNQSR